MYDNWKDTATDITDILANINSVLDKMNENDNKIVEILENHTHLLTFLLTNKQGE